MTNRSPNSQRNGVRPGIIIGQSDVLEEKYIYRLQSHLADYGLPIIYPKDRATIDLGIHLFSQEHSDTGDRTLSDTRIWMQCKSLRATTLTREVVNATGKIPVSGLVTEHVKFWYLATEAVYLVVYVESLDAFFARDIRQLIDEQVHPASPHELTRHRTITLTLTISDTLEKMCIEMSKHRSMRIDGAQFRGSPLNHSFDPLRTIFKPTQPQTFRNIVTDLLAENHFEPEGEVDIEGLFDRVIGQVLILRGVLNYRYEWTSPLFTEYGHDGQSNFRTESPTMSIQGRVVVVVHSLIENNPRRTKELDEQVRLWQELDIDAALVFYNGDSLPTIGAWRSALGGLCLMPQGIDSLSYNILTRPSLYRKYMYDLDPRVIHPAVSGT